MFSAAFFFDAENLVPGGGDRLFRGGFGVYYVFDRQRGECEGFG